MTRSKLLNILFTAILFSCSGKEGQDKGDSPLYDSIASIDKKKKSVIPLAANIVNIDSTAPFIQVARLVKAIEIEYNIYDMLELDDICAGSDGELSEYFNDVSINLFNKQLNNFIIYTSDHPKSCLKRKLIEELGSQYSVYPEIERKDKLLEEQRRIIQIGRKLGLSKIKRKYIETLFASVNPDILD